MPSLKDLITEELSEMESNGKIREFVKKHVESCVESAVQENTRYGNFRNGIREKVNEEFNGALQSVELPNYHKFIAECVHTAFSKVVEESLVPQITEALEEQLAGVEKTANLQDLMNWIEEQVRSDDELRERSDETWAVIEKRESTIEIDLTIDHEKFKVVLYDHRRDGNWYIGYIYSDKRPISGRAINVAAVAMGSVIQRLYNHYASRTTFDISNLETGELTICHDY